MLHPPRPEQTHIMMRSMQRLRAARRAYCNKLPPLLQIRHYLFFLSFFASIYNPQLFLGNKWSHGFIQWLFRLFFVVAILMHITPVYLANFGPILKTRAIALVVKGRITKSVFARM